MDQLIDDELAECQMSSFQQNMNATTTNARREAVGESFLFLAISLFH